MTLQGVPEGNPDIRMQTDFNTIIGLSSGRRVEHRRNVIKRETDNGRIINTADKRKDSTIPFRNLVHQIHYFSVYSINYTPCHIKLL